MLVETRPGGGVASANGCPRPGEDLLRRPLSDHLGDLRLGRGVYWRVLFPGPLLGSQESGVYSGEIEARVKGDDLRAVHFKRRIE